MHSSLPKLSCIILSLLAFLLPARGQNYQALWNLINTNKREEALQSIEPKIKNKSATIDEFLTYYYLQLFDGHEGEIHDFHNYISKSENPAAYIYALWFSGAVAGEYGQKEPHQLALLNELIDPNAGNGTLRAAAHYSLGIHYDRINQLQNSHNEHEKIGALQHWQFAGPFDNISGSGFNKIYGPVNTPSADSIFSSAYNAPVKWFSPAESSREGWVYPGYFIADISGNIAFAQTFVESKEDREVYLCSGFSGNLKVWINDRLVLSVPENRLTEIDAYSTKAKLKKGYNRILVQVGSDDNNSNFIVRLCDANFDPIADLSSTEKPQPYSKLTGEDLSGNIPLDAEVFFKNKIEQDPSNLVNYMLLNEVYLRNNKVFEARSIIENALQLAPDNSILKFELFLCYSKDRNQTGVLELMEYFLNKESTSLIGTVLKASELKQQEKYQEIIDLTKSRVERYGADVTTYDDLINAMVQLNLVAEAIAMVQAAAQQYPDNPKFLIYVYNVESKMNKNPKRAIKILEDYLADHHYHELVNMLAEEYFGQQNPAKAFKLIEAEINAYPYIHTFREELLRQYIEQQRYPEAFEICQLLLKQQPFSGRYLEARASIEQSLGRVEDAIASFHQAILYSPTLYEAREKLYTLEKKKSPFAFNTGATIDELLITSGQAINANDYDYYFIENKVEVVLYPEGGREEINTNAIRVMNERGIDAVSDLTLGYNENNETLIIEDAEIIKPNGNKIKPETHDNQIVWAGLETGDVIYYRYKIRSYRVGKFSREFYDKFTFESYVPRENSTYCLIVPHNKKVFYKVVNGDVAPVITETGDYTSYVWQRASTAGILEENYMPPLGDIAATLHVSTMDDWNEIANWYSDLVYSKIANDDDYEIRNVVNQLFQSKGNLSASEKAELIYNYIADNISYSSVSFRQSDIIPQRASSTLNGRLGDCKDISTLFVSLANLAGLKSNLVLVSTRDNGQMDMLLPSFLFNHCIVKYFDEQNEAHYLELTNRDLPFQSLPDYLFKAICLTIPARNESRIDHNLETIQPKHKTADKLISKSTIQVNNNNMSISNTRVLYGNLTSSWRKTFQSLSTENIRKEMQNNIGSRFDNPIKIENVTFTALDERLDSISTTTQFSVSNEVKKIGAQSAFLVPYMSSIFTNDPINTDDRHYEIEYWNYENTDIYETYLDIFLPAEKSFVDVPQNQTLAFRDIRYSLTFDLLAPNHLHIERTGYINRNNIKPAEYVDFRSFVTKILELEGAYLTFK